MKLVAIVLTFNERLHLARCLESLRGVVGEILVVDCFSSDDTLEIARAYGARVIQRSWVNYATQFNWALTLVDADADWILRIDADEVLTPHLADEIRLQLPALPSEVAGVYVKRRMKFQGREVRYGGLFPVKVLRIFRRGWGRCEERWMDEHIKVDGPTVQFSGEMVDDNLQSLTWWIAKHNGYASREAIDILNLEYRFMPHDSVANLRGGQQAGVKRWLKEKVYARLPAGFRALAYFFYRYVIRLGFLDGKSGRAFHFLQGFWYRYLVDVKISEVRRVMRKRGVDVQIAIREVLGVTI